MPQQTIKPVVSKLGFLWVWTIFWCAISYAMAWGIWSIKPAQWGMRLFVSLFVLIGVVAPYFVFRQHRKYLLTRGVTLILSEQCPRANQSFTAQLKLPEDYEHAHWLTSASLSLQLVQYEEDRSSSGGALIRSHALEHSVQAQRQPDGRWLLNATFHTPANAPATDAIRNGNRVVWQIELHDISLGQLVTFPIKMRAAEQPPLAWKTSPSNEVSGSIPSAHSQIESAISAEPAWPVADEADRARHMQKILPLELGQHPVAVPRDVAELQEMPDYWRAKFPRKAWRVFAIVLAIASVFAVLWARSMWHANSGLMALAEGIMGWLLACGLLAFSIHVWTKRWHLVVQDASFALDTSSALFRKIREFGAAQATLLRLEMIYQTRQSHQENSVTHFSVVKPESLNSPKAKLTPAIPSAETATALAHHFWQALAHRRMRFAAPYETQDSHAPALGPTAVERSSAWLGLLVMTAFYLAIAALSPKVQWADALSPQVIGGQLSAQAQRLNPKNLVASYKRDHLLEGYRRSNLQMVTEALSKGADPNAASEDGAPLLIDAAGRGDAAVVQALLKYGADVNIRNTADPNKYGDTALLVAFYKEHLDIAHLLLAAGADLRAKNRWDWGALHMAAQSNCIACLQWLLEQGFSPNEPAPASRGETPVMLAAGRNRLPSLQWLVKHGGSLEQKDPTGHNALAWAEFFKKQNTAEWIRKQNSMISS